MTNFVNGLNFTLLSTRDFEEPRLAREVLDVLLSQQFGLRPNKFGAFEPLKRRVVAIDEIVDVLVNENGPKIGVRYGSLLLEVNKNAGYSIQWNKSLRPTFSVVSGHLMFDVIHRKKDILESWISGIKALVEVLEPSYGEVTSMSVKGWDTPFNLQCRLPDIPPISIYGTDYISFFGKDKIEKAPFSKVTKVGRCYWLVANEDLMVAVLESKRSEIRSYFGEDAFMADGRWKYNDGRAPQFDLSNSLCK